MGAPLEVALRVLPSYQRDEMFPHVAIVQAIITKEAFWMNGNETSPSYELEDGESMQKYKGGDESNGRKHSYYKAEEILCT